MLPKTQEKMLRSRLARNLRTLRGERGMSQEGLADNAGLHRTFISEVERELRSLSLDNVEKLANALDVDPVELFKP